MQLSGLHSDFAFFPVEEFTDPVRGVKAQVIPIIPLVPLNPVIKQFDPKEGT
jgi:hypothetical protein